ncbi:MAG: 50S ribosomal protein L10 [Leptolyngbya sp. PLA3]|nr:MAG: 50S ribosomal protein L10 [Cyanobacteria bacterium CYA]MCE7968089.1 50S ribosomal protein L10 [Leptolyngbya sp. PL-A3]
MSKPVKQMIVRDYQGRVGDIEDAMLISLRGVSSNSTNKIRQTLAKKEIRVTVIRNSLFLKAFGDTKLAGLSPLLSGANALAYGAESVVEVAREIVGLLKDFPDIQLRGAVLDGQLFEGEDGVKALSKFPTRDEAIAKDVTLILSPGRKLLGAVKGPGGRLLGIVKAIEEKLEKGEAIAKV